jgi:hypothetical protein
VIKIDKTALMCAADFNGHTLAVKALLEAGADAGHLDEVRVMEEWWGFVVSGARNVIVRE